MDQETHKGLSLLMTNGKKIIVGQSKTIITQDLFVRADRDPGGEPELLPNQNGVI